MNFTQLVVFLSKSFCEDFYEVTVDASGNNLGMNKVTLSESPNEVIDTSPKRHDGTCFFADYEIWKNGHFYAKEETIEKMTKLYQTSVEGTAEACCQCMKLKKLFAIMKAVSLNGKAEFSIFPIPQKSDTGDYDMFEYFTVEGHLLTVKINKYPHAILRHNGRWYFFPFFKAICGGEYKKEPFLMGHYDSTAKPISDHRLGLEDKFELITVPIEQCAFCVDDKHFIYFESMRKSYNADPTKFHDLQIFDSLKDSSSLFNEEDIKETKLKIEKFKIDQNSDFLAPVSSSKEEEILPEDSYPNYGIRVQTLLEEHKRFVTFIEVMKKTSNFTMSAKMIKIFCISTLISLFIMIGGHIVTRKLRNRNNAKQTSPIPNKNQNLS